MNAVGIDVSKGKSMVAIMQWIRLLRMLRLWHIWVSMVHLIFFTFDFPVCTYRVLILFAFLYILMYICAWFTALVCQKHKFIFLLVVGIYTISCCTGNFLPFQRIAAFSTLYFCFQAVWWSRQFRFCCKWREAAGIFLSWNFGTRSDLVVIRLIEAPAPCL